MPRSNNVSRRRLMARYFLVLGAPRWEVSTVRTGVNKLDQPGDVPGRDRQIRRVDRSQLAALGPSTLKPADVAADATDEDPFSAFDEIICINLDSRPDRWTRMRTRFETLGIADRVRRLPAVLTPQNRHVGCALS